MEALGETMENIGLAQEIQKGLAPNLQKPPKWADFQGESDAKKAEFSGMSGWDCYSSGELCKGVIKMWGKDKGLALTKEGVDAKWDEFKASKAMDVLAKYAALGDKLAKEPVTVKLFEEVRPLGRGAFGAVFLVFKKDTGAPMATKKMFKTNAKHNKMLSDLLIEREVLSKIRSPFCVNLHYAFQSDIEVSLVLTLMPGGDLAFLLQSRHDKGTFNPLGDSVVKFYAAAMAIGLQAIHEAGYVYRDLKPQNVLLDVEGQVRISDMGLTAWVKDKEIKQCSGTRGYWSPETIQKQHYKFQPDWWSLGVTVYSLTSDKMPFYGNDEEKDAMTCAGNIDFKHGESPGVQKLITDLCTVDMTKRLGCTKGLEDLKGHPFFSGFDWAKMMEGELEAEIKPNPNDINAPSKKDIEGFKPSKEVTWEPDDQARFSDWNFFDKEIWGKYEALFRIEKKMELAGGGGGGGCCVIA